ncbi:endonuclease/exonuclease/phosphatase family protein [Fontivita pretiosa]|uniref:endonuclease/exonuclease/phosphatase family protein n=1 Tax=Fontivita pretiosa TaxID=2989684 RepID=UPI003D162C79
MARAAWRMVAIVASSGSIVASIGCGWLSAATGTVLDRELPGDVRVATWNIHNDSIFADVNPSRAQKFGRVVRAVDADVWNFQEIYNHSATQIREMMNSVAPLPGGASWFVYKGGGEHAIVSKYPLSLTASNTSPPGYRAVAMALVNLPDASFARDLYLMNAHYKCCSGFDAERQMQSDAFVNWMRDARSAGGSITLAAGTPMVVLGDLNIVESFQPVTTLLSGDIQNETTYGPDSPPDWDGSSMIDAAPTHNAAGVEQYTWRNDLDIYPPSRLDFILYTDSTMLGPHRFALNTVAMSSSDRAAANLGPFDSILDDAGATYDHLPLVIDFRLSAQRTLKWNGASGATWHSGGSDTWIDTVTGAATAAFAAGDVVRFSDAGVGVVQIASSGVSPGAVLISNATGTYSFIGGAIGGSGRLSKSGEGTLVLAAGNTFTGGTEIYGGTLHVAHPNAVQGGTLLAARSARVILSPTLPAAVTVRALSIIDSATLDLTDNTLRIDYDGTSPIRSVRQLLLSGALFSSTAQATQRIGYIEAAGTALLVQTAAAGDANLDGLVDAIDLEALSLGWQQTDAFWTAGDFTYDGVVNLRDLYLLAQNWQPSSQLLYERLAALGLPANQLPEPGLFLVGVTAWAAIVLRPGRRRGG